MATWNLGSVQNHIGNRVGWSNISNSISGTVLNDIIEQNLFYVSQRTGDSISSSAIEQKYQPPIINFTMSDVLNDIDAQEGETSSVKLGELSVNQSSSKSTGASSKYREMAEKQLIELGRKQRFKQVFVS